MAEALDERPLYRARRERLLDQHPEGLVLVRGTRADGGPSPNLRYLTGLEEPRAVLLLSRGGVRVGTGARYPGPNYVRGRTVHQLLLLPAADPLARRWGEESGATIDRVEAQAVGVDAVLGLDELEALLARALQASPLLHYVRAAEPTLLGPPDPDSRFVSLVRERLFGVEVRDATSSVHEARRVKGEEEIRAIERAVELTAHGLARAVARIAAGIRECELEAEITRLYRAHGATHAFPPIVATGSHAALPHYQANTGRLEPGQLVLIDTGASCDGYKGDVTRTYPVDGRFSGRQREVYEAVLRARDAAFARCRPGALLADIHGAAWQVIDLAGWGPTFIHGTSHHLGLETHDPGDVHRPLEPGAVITVEPGIYLPEEGLGVRIEDDVLVTAGEPRILSEAIPSSVEAIERTMA